MTKKMTIDSEAERLFSLGKTEDEIQEALIANGYSAASSVYAAFVAVRDGVKRDAISVLRDLRTGLRLRYVDPSLLAFSLLARTDAKGRGELKNDMLWECVKAVCRSTEITIAQHTFVCGDHVVEKGDRYLRQESVTDNGEWLVQASGRTQAGEQFYGRALLSSENGFEDQLTHEVKDHAKI